MPRGAGWTLTCRALWRFQQSSGHVFLGLVCILPGARGLMWMLTELSWDTSRVTLVVSLPHGAGCVCQDPVEGTQEGRPLPGLSPPWMWRPQSPAGLAPAPCSGPWTLHSGVREPEKLCFGALLSQWHLSGSCSFVSVRAEQSPPVETFLTLALV